MAVDATTALPLGNMIRKMLLWRMAIRSCLADRPACGWPVESREDKAAFMTDQMQHFFRHVAGDLATQGRLSLYFLQRGEQRLASLLCFDGSDDLMLYNSGYDPAYADVSVGIVSKAMCLQRAIQDSKRRFNFLRGSERYKYAMGAIDSPVYHCRLIRR